MKIGIIGASGVLGRSLTRLLRILFRNKRDKNRMARAIVRDPACAPVADDVVIADRADESVPAISALPSFRMSAHRLRAPGRFPKYLDVLTWVASFIPVKNRSTVM